MRPLSAPRPARVVAAAAVAAFVTSSIVDPSVAAQTREWIPPVEAAVVRPFVAPIAEYASGHRGVDFAAARGTAVRASNDGTVSFAGTVAETLHVVVAHQGGIRTSYSFLASADVRAGQQVSRGQVIGRAGGSGDGHGAGVLHFGVRIGDRYVDPMLLFQPRDLTQIVRLVPSEELEAAEQSTPAEEREELVRQIRDAFGCAICDAGDWVADRAEEAFQAGRDALVAAKRTVERWVDGAIDNAKKALDHALSVAGAIRDAILDTPMGRLATDFVQAGATLLGWFGRECDEEAPPANGRGGSGDVMYAVGGIDSHKDTPDGRSFNLPARLLGYDESERHWFSYREGSDTYTKGDTYQDLRKSARLLAQQLKEAAKKEPGRKFDLVGHSQGGVVIELFLIEFYDGHEDEYPPVENVVTFASPLQGTPTGTSGDSLRKKPGGRALMEALGRADEELDLPIPDPNAKSVQQLSENSDVIDEIKEAGVPDSVNFTSIGAVEDFFVPSSNTRLAGAQSHEIDTGGLFTSHSAITHDSRALMAARAALEHRALPCTSFDDALKASAQSLVMSAVGRAASSLP